MATLNAAQQGLTYRSALGKIGQSPDFSSVQLAQWLRDEYENNPVYAGITYSSYAAIARRALAAHYAAEAMESDRDFTPTAGELETIPGSQFRTDRFQYRVVVNYVDETGQTVSSIFEYESPTAVSFNQIYNDLTNRALTTSDGRTVDVAGIQIPGHIANFDIRILAAGRRAT